MIFLEEQITGTLIHDFMTCKRGAWLCARQMHGDQENEYLLMGKALALAQENKNLHEIQRLSRSIRVVLPCFNKLGLLMTL